MTGSNKFGRLTTHVLDTANGCPAAGLKIELLNDEGRPIVSTDTNSDGRCDEPLLAGDALQEGAYELRFHVGTYFGEAAKPEFLDIVPVRFVISDASQHYHVPLLVAPYGYSTYRGS